MSLYFVMQSAFKNKKSDHVKQIEQVLFVREYHSGCQSVHFARFNYPNNKTGDFNNAVPFIFFIPGIIYPNVLFHFVRFIDRLFSWSKNILL